MLTVTWVHALRILRTWFRNVGDIIFLSVVPVAQLYIVDTIFGNLVDLFTSAFSIEKATVLTAVSWAFMLATTSGGAIVAERRSGLHDRFWVQPQGFYPALLGRWLAEFVRATLSVTIVCVAASVFLHADLVHAFGWVFAPVLLLVCFASSGIATVIGFSIQDAQGAVTFVPLVVAAMFLNTAMMPADSFGSVLRHIVEYTPISAVVHVLLDSNSLRDWVLFAAWIGGFTFLALVLIAKRGRGQRWEH
ncbi:ABC transporter permease [Corynebacterium sp.]|uniref:ABC transporter permease n=1 Tax=Corynebacterium sp. TaxID=1720 RepID=UPI0026DD3E11|nr:ABC transporter permease [Corynebacterium sp.]MDO5077828.1 ABC transporter permease [Corynebacterium sp.]